MGTHAIWQKLEPVRLQESREEWPEYFPLLGIDEEPDEPNGSGDLLNQSFDRYRLFHSDDALSDLFREVEDYARRSVLKESAAQGWKSPTRYLDDIVQETLTDVWRGLDTFEGRSKFSSWVYQIARNNTADVARKTARLNEVQYLEWRANCQEYCGTQNAGNTGHTPESEKADDAYARRILNSLGDQSEDVGGYVQKPLMPRSFIELSETACNKRIDLQLAFRRFRADDRQIAILFFCYGYTAREIAQVVGKDTHRASGKCSRGERWIQNRLVAIKRVLAATMTTVPRVRLTGKSEIEQAYVKFDRYSVIRIEFEHAVSTAALRRLTRPYDPDRDDGFSVGSEPNKGRSIFLFTDDQRTEGSRGQEVTTSEKLLANPSNLPGCKRLSSGEDGSFVISTTSVSLPSALQEVSNGEAEPCSRKAA